MATLYIALSGSTLWGGCSVWVSYDGGVTYELDGKQKGGTAMGVLTAALPAGNDPDTVNSIQVNLSESNGLLDSFTQAQADNSQSLVVIDQEMIAYTAVTQTSTENFTLGGYLRRGVNGTAITPHAIGAPFAAFDGTEYEFNYPTNYIGKTIFFKFTSFNQAGQNEESLANVTPYTHTLDGGDSRPPFPLKGGGGLITHNGSTVTAQSALMPNAYSFSLTQSYTNNADTSATPNVTINALLPPSLFSSATKPPVLSPATWAAFTGPSPAFVGTGQTLAIGATSYDNLNQTSKLSNLVYVTLPDDGNKYQINVPYAVDDGCVGIHVFLGAEQDTLTETSQAVPSAGVITIAEPDTVQSHLIGPPDPQAQQIVLVAQYENHGGAWGGTVSSYSNAGSNDTIKVTGAGWGADQWAGRYVSLLATALISNVSSSILSDALILSNTSNTLTISGHVPGENWGAGDIIAIRTQATTFGEFQIGDANFVNAAAPGGLTDNEAGCIIRIIGGTGAGQPDVLAASNNNTTYQTQTGFNPVPDATSVFIVLNPTKQPEFLSTVLKVNQFDHATVPVNLNIPNLAATWRIQSFLQDANGNRSREDIGASLEFFLFGNPGPGPIAGMAF